MRWRDLIGLVVLAWCACVPRVRSALQRAPSVTVSLDVPPEQRWDKALAASLDAHGFQHGFLPVFAHYNASVFDDVLPHERDWAALEAATRRTFPTTFAELQGIAAAFARRGHVVTPAYLVGWLWIHELEHVSALGQRPRACTGAVASRPGTGTGDGMPLHVRNMDQSPPAARNLTLELSFVKDGAELAKAVSWYWLTSGVETLLVPGSWAAQENWRFQGVARSDLLSAVASGTAVPQMLVFRRLAEARASYASVLAALTTPNATTLAAGWYVVVSGAEAGQGAVVTQGPHGAVDGVDELGKRTAYSANRWFLAQTNYDPWAKDEPTDARRTAAVELLSSGGQNRSATPAGLLAIAASYPVKNADTAYTALLDASMGTVDAWVHSVPMVPTSG